MAESIDLNDENLVIDQLRQLGYSDIPEESLKRFKEELLLTCSEFTGSNISDNDGYQASISVSTPFSTIPSVSSRFSSSTLSPIETDECQKSSRSVMDSSVVSSCSSSGKTRKPLIRKNVRKVNGKSTVYVESKSESSLLENLDVPSNISNSNHFTALSPETITSDGSYDNTNSDFSAPSNSPLTPSSTPMELDESYGGLCNSNYANLSSSSVQKFAKRKALRSINGKPVVSIEKISKNAQSLSQFNELIDSAMHASDNSSCMSDIDINFGRRSNHSKLKRYHSDEDIRISKYYSKSFIRPPSCGAYGQRSRKSDPVQRYHEYRQYWDAFKTPGEKSHNYLRWMVREHMMSEPAIRPIEKNLYSLQFGRGRSRRKSCSWQI